MRKPLEVTEVESKQDLKAFIDFPHKLYEGDKNYVPELYIEMQALLSKGKNPFFEHAQAAYFLAKREGEIVGRIAAIKDENYIQATGENRGVFGFFDCPNDQTIASALLSKAVDWLKNLNISEVVGPMNLSSNYVSFVLIEGFEQPPYVMMSYNKPYYKDLIETFGFTKKIDCLAYSLSKEAFSNARFSKLKSIAKIVEERLKRSHIMIRNLDFKNFDKEVQLIQEVYNEAWEKNTDFVPMTEKEFRITAAMLKKITDPKSTFIAMAEGKAIGVSIAIPNVNEKLIKINRGRLSPLAIWHLLGIKKIKTFRVVIQGVVEQYRHLGIDTCFIAKLAEYGESIGAQHVELSWILENNAAVNNMFSKMGLPVYKKYRLYRKEI